MSEVSEKPSQTKEDVVQLAEQAVSASKARAQVRTLHCICSYQLSLIVIFTHTIQY